MDAGQLAALRGMNLATGAEERDNPGFVERALNAIIAVAERQSTVHIDDLAEFHSNDPPIHNNCWGHIWIKARKLGIIVPTGEWKRASKRTIKHARCYPVYASLLHKEDPKPRIKRYKKLNG
jgi:hypothetical protein